MALELKLKRGAVSADLDYYYLEDNTGVYDADTNPTGYGGSNFTLRAELALYLYGYKYRKDSADEAIVISNLIPTTATSWQIPMSEDGYSYFRLLGFAIYDPASAYIADELVFYATGYYKSLDVVAPGQDPINNSTLWVALTTADLISDAIYEHSSLVTGFTDQVVNYRAKQCYQVQVQLEAEGCCDCHSKDRTKTKIYQKIFVHLNAAAFDCLQQKYQQADEELVYLAEYCQTIQCKHCNV
jgi:hypothetical protein